MLLAGLILVSIGLEQIIKWEHRDLNPDQRVSSTRAIG